MPRPLLLWAFLQRSKIWLLNFNEDRGIPLELMRYILVLGDGACIVLECFAMGSSACNTEPCIKDNSYSKEN